MLRKTQIILCLGSSCFARGNQKIIQMVKNYIENRNLSDWVEFKGDHCFDECSEGPNMYIGSKLFQKISVKNINKILDLALTDMIKKTD
jgi:NADH:ubiquinone oxidoreductase subunit E